VTLFRSLREHLDARRVALRILCVGAAPPSALEAAASAGAPAATRAPPRPPRRVHVIQRIIETEATEEALPSLPGIADAPRPRRTLRGALRAALGGALADAAGIFAATAGGGSAPSAPPTLELVVNGARLEDMGAAVLNVALLEFAEGAA
jgi:hypothetical protein